MSRITITQRHTGRIVIGLDHAQFTTLFAFIERAEILHTKHKVTLNATERAVISAFLFFALNGKSSIPVNRLAGAIDWIHVEKDLPDDEITVLVAIEDGEVWTASREAGKWVYVSGDPLESRVTHWAHFPPPPNHAVPSVASVPSAP